MAVMLYQPQLTRMYDHQSYPTYQDISRQGSSRRSKTLRLSKSQWLALSLCFTLHVQRWLQELQASRRQHYQLILWEQGIHFPEPPADFPLCPLVRIVSHVHVSVSHWQGQWNCCDWFWPVRTHILLPVPLPLPSGREGSSPISSTWLLGK